MVNELMRLGITLPMATHDAMRQLSFKRSVEAGKPVTLADVYSEAVKRLGAMIEAGEEVIFPIAPRGSVRRISLRLPPDIMEIITKHCPLSSQSAIVAKAAHHLLQDDK